MLKYVVLIICLAAPAICESIYIRQIFTLPIYMQFWAYLVVWTT